MNINCPKCSFGYEIDDNKIPDDGANVKCSQCGDIFEVPSPKEIEKLYVKIDESIYETTLSEVREWIIERRVLATHEISKDKTFWMPLNKHPDLLTLFPKDEIDPLADEPTHNFLEEKKEKEKELKQKQEEIEKTAEQLKAELQGDLDGLQKHNNYQSLNYSDYDDSSVDLDYTPSKKGKFLILTFILILVAGGVFALMNPKMVKGFFNKVTNKKEKKNTYFADGMKNLDKSNFPDQYLLSKKFFVKSIEASKGNNKEREKGIAGKSLMYALSLFYYKTDYLSDEKMISKIMLHKEDEEKFKILKPQLKNLTASLTKNKKNYKTISTYFKNDISEVERISKDNINAATAMGIWSYLENKSEDLTKYISIVEILDKNSKYLEFLKILKKELENPDKLLSDVKFQTSSSVNVNYLFAQKLLANSNFDLSLASFKTAVTLAKRHDPAAINIDRLKFYIAHKDLLPKIEVKKDETKKDETKKDETKKDETDEKKDEAKKEVKKDEAKDESKKETIAKKVVKKAKKRSPKQEAARGWNLLDAGNNNGAIRSFKKAIDGNPKLADAYHGIGEAYKALGNKQKALYYFKECLAVNPSYEEANLVKNYIKKLQ